MTDKKIVIVKEPGARLDAWLASEIEDISRTYIRTLIDNGLVLVNDSIKKPSHIVETGDRIEITIPPPEPTDIPPAEIPLEILHEDEDIIVINKQAGLVTHPSHGHRDDTLVNALLNYNINLSNISGEKRPGIVHRLDKDTSGVMVIAKNNKAHENLSAQFKDRLVQKEYRCIVRGRMRNSKGIIDDPIGRDKHNRKKFAVNLAGGKEAESHFEALEKFQLATYVKVNIMTGRTHQIRVHMASIGYPVIGDTVYGRGWNPGKEGSVELRSFLKDLDRVMLHSYRLTLFHPTTAEQLEFTAPLPEEFNRLLKYL
ncbi:MAG: RluA family pseudouridine synthase [Acidobacteria bacterium]|nr:RluA family pseudouridine synthase [Acidobacteriota bacterium]